MKRIGLSITVFLMVSSLYAQSWVGIGAGGNRSNIYYENSNGEQDKTVKGVVSSYASIYYMLDVSVKKSNKEKYHIPENLILLELGYKKAQARDSDSRISSTWTMDYVASAIGLRHSFNIGKRIAPYFGAAFSVDYLVSGVQQIGFEQYDLTDELNSLNMGVVAEGGLKYSIKEDVVGNFGMSYNYGVSNLEENNQVSRLSGFKIGLGIHFLISN